MLIEQLTMPEFADGLRRTQTVCIPFGSVEEHGRHLPLSTDTVQAYRVCCAVAEQIPVFVAPPIHYGNCRSTSCHPGTISITTQTVKLLCRDIVRSCYKQGLRTFVIITGHAGGAHRMALQESGEQLLCEFPDARIAVLCEYELACRVGKTIIETKDDAHAGEIETSRIMHYLPDQVKGISPCEYPSFPEGILVSNKRAYWPGGVWGDPGKATIEKGERLHHLVVNYLIQFIRDLETFTQ